VCSSVVRWLCRNRIFYLKFIHLQRLLRLIMLRLSCNRPGNVRRSSATSWKVNRIF
jgi:hypothetical protein